MTTRCHFPLPLLLAAATLAGCASSDRMMRLSPLAEATPEAGKHVGAAQESRLGGRPLTDDRVNVFPLYYAAGGMTSFCWPIADWDDRGWAVRPLYNREGENQSVLFPLSAWDNSGGWALNTVWDDKKGWMFAPFFGSWNKTDFVFPVFVTERPGESEPAVRVFPLWYSDAHESRLEPLFAQKRDDRGLSREVLYGLLYNDELSASGDTRSTWLFPVGYHRRDASSSVWLSLPVSAGHDARESWFNVHPLWWSSSGDGWSSELLLPLWYRNVTGDARACYTPLGFSFSRGADAQTATWLYSYGHDARRSWFNIHPLWWSSQGESGESRLLFPVYYSMREGDASVEYNPLWLHRRRGDYDSVVSWLHSRGSDTDERWFNVHPLWWSWSSRNESSSLLLPVYWRFDDGKVATAYTPLGFHERAGADARWLTLPFSSGHAGDRSWLNIHPLWWSSDSPHASMRALFPLYYHSREGESSSTFTPLGWRESTGENHRLVTLPYSEGRQGGRTWFNIHPLWWSSDAPDASMHALAPFYYTARAGESHETYSWLGYHGVAGADSRWVTLPFSAGRAGERTWLNIHPLWWSSDDGKRRVRTLLPLWSSERLADGAGSLLSPLGYSEYAPGGECRFVNVLGLGYQWERESDTTTARHALWPVYADRHTTAEVDGEFVGRFALVVHETAPNVDAFRLTPLWSQASGPGVSPARDWCHLVSRRTLAGETSTTVTPLVETVSNAADGRWRVTPLASSAELQGDTIWRDWLHLISVRRDEGGTSYSVTPLCQNRAAHAASELRLTPMFDTGTGKYAPMDPWTPHLFVHGREGERRFWSFTPLAVGMRTADAESEHVWPFYAFESRGGATVSQVVFPFYSEGSGDSWAEALCVVRHLRTPERDVRTWFGPVWRREIFKTKAEPEPDVLLAPQSRRTETTGSLFTTEELRNHRWVEASFLSEEERASLRLWLSETVRLGMLERARADAGSPEAKDIRTYWAAGRVATLQALHERVIALVRAHGGDPGLGTVASVRESLGGLVAAHGRSGDGRRFAVDPLGVEFYWEERSPGIDAWSFLFGLGHGEFRDGLGRASVFGYLYTKEVSPDGVRLNCFPFIQRDETTERRKVSFLWRVWNRETEVKTGKVKGHFLFIPY